MECCSTAFTGLKLTIWLFSWVLRLQTAFPTFLLSHYSLYKNQVTHIVFINHFFFRFWYKWCRSVSTTSCVGMLACVCPLGPEVGGIFLILQFVCDRVSLNLKVTLLTRLSPPFSTLLVLPEHATLFIFTYVLSFPACCLQVIEYFRE